MSIQGLWYIDVCTFYSIIHVSPEHGCEEEDYHKPIMYFNTLIINYILESYTSEWTRVRIGPAPVPLVCLARRTNDPVHWMRLQKSWFSRCETLKIPPSSDTTRTVLCTFSPIMVTSSYECNEGPLSLVAISTSKEIRVSEDSNPTHHTEW